MSFPPPQRILLLRPDAYGDLFLFEPIPRLVHQIWPQAEVAVLIREPYADAVPLLGWDGIQLLTTRCDPYRDGPAGNPAALVALRAAVEAFEPDCLVAACEGQSWLEAAVAAFAPAARQICLGPGLTDPLVRAALEKEMAVDWPAIYPERVLLDPTLPEWEKNLRLVSALLGQAAPRWWPVAHVPASAQEQAHQILADLRLPPGAFVSCAAAGLANVQIKGWPARHYGEILAWLELEHGIRALLFGSAAERETLTEAQQAARQHGADPALWLGEPGEMPVVAGLLSAARFYFGNDTGALHLAAALGRPVVPIFGGGHWPRFQPVARRSLTIVQLLPCFGCAWECYFEDGPCVRTIPPSAVRQALAQFLAGGADGNAIFEAGGLEPGARALLDAATPKFRGLRADNADRIRQISRLTELLEVSEADRQARLATIAELSQRLESSEADRTARLAQIDEMSQRLQDSEADRAARLDQVADLGARLEVSDADRTSRLAQVKELGARLAEAETDRAARYEQIKQLTAWLQASEAGRDPSVRAIEEIGATGHATTGRLTSDGETGKVAAKPVSAELHDRRALSLRESD